MLRGHADASRISLSRNEIRIHTEMAFSRTMILGFDLISTLEFIKTDARLTKKSALREGQVRPSLSFLIPILVLGMLLCSPEGIYLGL